MGCIAISELKCHTFSYMTPILIKPPKDESLNVISHLIQAGQKVLSHDWRYQEIQTALYQPELTHALDEVWQFWAAKVPHTLPEFSALRNLPQYEHEKESIIGNVNQALRKGGKLIMSSPLLTPHCHGATISLTACWQNNKLIFVVRKPAALTHPMQELVFESFEKIYEAIRAGIADNRVEVFNFAPTQQEN